MKLFFLPLIFWVTHVLDEDPINFDGQIEAGEWENAQTYTIDYEINPGNNISSPNKTTAYVKYTPQYLWVGFDAKADPKSLRSAIRNRDEAYIDDIVMIGIDTYGDGRYMVAVGANAEASQVDLKFLANGDDDTTYDVNFESKAVKTDTGYHVELKIPFAAFQFKNTPHLEWNVLFYRSTYTNGVRSQNMSFPIDRNNACLPCQAKEKIVLDDIKPKKRFNLLPYAFGGVSGESVNSELEYGKGNINAGLGGLIDLSNVTSLEYSLNPDFSQVEADVSRINANTTFAIYFPERRPYFNEGNDLIDTELRTVYTRSINQPLFSSKLIHQGEKQRLYWLTAYDNKTAYLIGGENESYFGKGSENISNIFRYQRNFSQGSHIGLITTNRFIQGGGDDHTFGLTAQFRFLKSYAFALEWNQSLTKEPHRDWIDATDNILGKTVALDGETFNGDALYFQLQRNTKSWNTEIEYQHNSPLYRSPLGFSVNNSVRSLEIEHEYQHFYKEKFVKRLVMGSSLDLTFNYDQLRKYSGLGLYAFAELAGNLRSEVSFNHGFNEEYKGFFAENLFSMDWWIGFNPSEAIRLNVYAEFGESIGYRLDETAVGDSFFFGTFNSFQINDKLRVSPSIRYSELRSKIDSSLYYKGYIARTNINYQFNNNLSFRLIGEFNDFDQKFFVQPLLKWNPNPFTIFYLGGNNGYSRMDNTPFIVDNSQFYVKFQYFIGI